MVNQVTIASGSRNLSGAVHFPSNQPKIQKPAIVFVHGFVGSKVGEHRLFVKAARHFTEQGFVVVRFDFSGCGESDGDYGDVTLTKQRNELKDVLSFVEELPDVNREEITVIAHSLGGAVASLVAKTDTRIKQLVLWSPVANPYEDITRITGKHAVKQASQHGIIDYKGFYVSHDFFGDLKKHHPLQNISFYQGPVFILHADKDQDVPKENAELYFKCLSIASIELQSAVDYIEHADHTFTSYAFENELFLKTGDWLKSLIETTVY
ncbi:alpha/beta hydrolase [Bacillus alkalicellulosilyticus]|uniref:alpha/beta hydrolase n=1 Tax=Alkalihalobacterium alkalicellulosilyticum TaxID=1912214 RepID=UPI000998728C|nr:alpha/beta hydrolase [Bacillus alkalicellulosilyticus]